MAHRLCAGIGVWCGGASTGMAGQGMLPLLQTRPVESRNHLRTENLVLLEVGTKQSINRRGRMKQSINVLSMRQLAALAFC